LQSTHRNGTIHATMTSLTSALIDAAIERIANGEILKVIAADYNIDKRRLSEQLRQHPEYRIAKIVRNETNLDDAQAEIKIAIEQSDIARARSLWSAATWRAERECPEEWGQHQTVTVDHRITVEQAIAGDAQALLGRVIEGQIVDNQGADVTDGALSVLCQPDSLDAPLPADCAEDEDEAP